MILQFSPAAWLKLLFFRDAGDTEVGGFGVTREGNFLYVEEFVPVKQECTWATVDFDDEAVADHFEDRLDAGVEPNRCGRVWLHTHPGSSVTPSGTDEDTFDKQFGACSHALMFILGKGGETYARLKVKGFGAILLSVQVDWERTADLVHLIDKGRWQAEYDALVTRRYYQTKWVKSKWDGDKDKDNGPVGGHNAANWQPLHSLTGYSQQRGETYWERLDREERERRALVGRDDESWWKELDEDVAYWKTRIDTEVDGVLGTETTGFAEEAE